MAFFDRFFKSTPPLTLEQKIDALAAYSTEQLVDTINSDEVVALKHAAIHYLPFGDELLGLATSTPRSPFEAQARKRIGELLDENKLTVDELAKRISDQALLLTLCGYSASAGIALVLKIDDEDLLLQLAKSSATTVIRQAAAEKIHTLALLLDLQKVAKNKDKSVSKIVRDKLDEHKQREIQNNKINDEGAALCNQLEQLAKRNIGEHYTAQQEQLKAAWKPLANAVSEAIKERFALAMANCETKLGEYEAEIQKQKHIEEVERSAKKQLLAAITDVQRCIAELFSSEQPTEMVSQLEVLENTFNGALKSAKENGLNTNEEERNFKALMDHARQLMNKLSDAGSLPSLLAALDTISTQTIPAQAAPAQTTPEESASPESAIPASTSPASTSPASTSPESTSPESTIPQTGAAIKKAILSIISHAKALQSVAPPSIIGSSQHRVDEWNRDARARAQAAKTQVSESFALIRRGFAAVGDGQIRRARAIFNDLEKRIAGLGSLPAQLDVKYDEFKAAINTLGDWHEFSVTPKKEALIESMEGLVSSTLHPKDLAERVRVLQEEWKTLSKGGQQDDSALWEQFQAAGKLAYEPCKTYFAQEALEREKNTQQRHQLNQQLQQYLDDHDWDNANWKDVEKTLRVARETWQSFWPVVRKNQKELQATFDTITGAIYQKVSDEFERNRLKKQAIVDTAKQLLENGDIGAAIESAKKLQSEWQAVGRAKPRVDQELWKAFRAHCDAVFEKRKQESEAERQSQDAEKQRADEILAQLDTILALNGPEFFAAKSQAEELADAFKALGEFPKNHSKSLNHKFQQFSESFQNKIAFERKQAQLSAWADIFSANEKLNELEILAANKEAFEALAQSLGEIFSTAQKWPSAILLNLQLRLDASESYSLEMQDENLHQLRLLCVRSEIANDIATPAEDKNLRMEFQMAQLQRGLGSQVAQEDASLEALVADWVAVKAVANAEYQKLEVRFRAALGLS